MRGLAFAILVLPSLALAQAPPRPVLDDNVLDDALENNKTQAPPAAFTGSPQRWAYELKFGPYSPDVDSTPGLHGKPFSELFQDQFSKADVGQRPAGKLLTTMELDYQLWHGFGSLGVAGSMGIMRRSTHGFQYNNDQPCTVGVDCIRSGDTTTFSVIPVAVEGVYRFDVAARRWHIPLVPYLKAGVAYYAWWIENGAGDFATSRTNPQDKAYGGTWGLVAHPGVALLLDIFDPTAARTFDNEMGINHSYLFFELAYAWITGLGSSDKMVLSDTTWNAGLAFEF